MGRGSERREAKTPRLNTICQRPGSIPKALRGKLEQNDREFVMVSGELSDHEFLGLLVTACGWIRRERA